MSHLTKEQINDVFEYTRKGPDHSPHWSEEDLLDDFDYFVRIRANPNEWYERSRELKQRKWVGTPVEERQRLMDEANQDAIDHNRINTMKKVEEVDAAWKALWEVMVKVPHNQVDELNAQIRNAVTTHKGMITSQDGDYALPYPAREAKQILAYPYEPTGESE